MKKAAFLLLAFFLPSIMSACTYTHGNEKVKTETIQSLFKKIILNETTKIEIQRYYGLPNEKKFSANGNETWTYIWIFSNPTIRHAGNKTLSLVFDKSDRVIDFSISEAKL